MAMMDPDDRFNRRVEEELIKHGKIIEERIAQGLGVRIDTLKSREAAVQEAYRALNAALLDQGMTATAELFRARFAGQ